MYPTPIMIMSSPDPLKSRWRATSKPSMAATGVLKDDPLRFNPPARAGSERVRAVRSGRFIEGARKNLKRTPIMEH